MGDHDLRSRRGSFGVVDAEAEPEGTPPAPRVLSRAQVVGQPIAEEVFAIADAIFMKDPRLEEIRGWRLETAASHAGACQGPCSHGLG